MPSQQLVDDATASIDSAKAALAQARARLDADGAAEPNTDDDAFRVAPRSSLWQRLTRVGFFSLVLAVLVARKRTAIVTAAEIEADGVKWVRTPAAGAGGSRLVEVRQHDGARCCCCWCCC